MVQFLTKNSKILKEYRLLALKKYREKKRKIILEGPQLFQEALRARVELEAVFYTEEFLKKGDGNLLAGVAPGTKIFMVEPRLFKTVAQTETPQGIGAIAHLPNIPPALPPVIDFMLILDGLQDPGNLGTIIRTAASAAVDAILLLPGTVDPYNPKALRASMGGVFYLPVLWAGKQRDWYVLLRKRNVQLIAAEPQGEVPYYELSFDQPSAVIIGNESRGVRASLSAKANARAFIPLSGKIAALNAAIAASLFIFENQRQRRICSGKNPGRGDVT